MTYLNAYLIGLLDKLLCRTFTWNGNKDLGSLVISVCGAALTYSCGGVAGAILHTFCSLEP